MRIHCLALRVLSSRYHLAALVCALAAAPASAAPRVVLISLDGATPRLLQEFLRDGTIPADRGLGLLARIGAVAERNTTVNPSLTAGAHIAMTTGSSAARNDVPSNTFHLVASPFVAAISGFSADALKELVDTNPNYALGRKSVPVFDKIFSRPTSGNPSDPDFGLRTNDVIGQDSGDVYATLSLGYNFDGTQSPVVARLGDGAATAAVLSVPNFYGAHGYDPKLAEMSAIFFAAGPHVCRHEIEEVRNIDLAPTILRLLGVPAADTVEGRALRLCDEDLRGGD
jgi:Type I phosphodiesterase / nucleotide pyrophosphatase